MPSNAIDSCTKISKQAAALLMEGRVTEASRRLAETLAQDDAGCPTLGL